MQFIDNILNKITMYRLTLYYLIFLIGTAVVLGFLGFLTYKPLDILISTFIAIIVCYITNLVFSKFFKATANVESVFITALILVLIVPVKFPVNFLFIIGASGLSMAVKYLLTIEKRHVFNPAAVSVAAIALLSPEHTATWWVGTPIMLPFVFFGGILLVRKIRREQMVFNFFFAYFVIIAIASLIDTHLVSSIFSKWEFGMLHSAIFFFAFVMFTEPLTTPSTEDKRLYYAYFVALLYATPMIRFLPFGLSPENSLVLGNVLSYFISPNYRLEMFLKWKKQLSPDTFEFAFTPATKVNFIPGQYMEWTLPHKNADSRGVRRYFSISSSPTEEDLAITVKFYVPSSSYKKELLSLTENKKIIASSLAGDFTLGSDFKKPVVFIAGGVGIAPFRSIIQYILDNNLIVDIILIFTNRTKEDIIFSDVFEKARKNGVNTIYVLTDANKLPADWQGLSGHLTEESIEKSVPDYGKRTFYISGPQLMVQNFEKILLSIGIKRNKIVMDFFPGYSETK